MAYAKTSLRREKRLLRDQMRSMGLGYRDIAGEFARRYGLRSRAAWREAYGWSLQDTADRINDFRGQVGLDPGGFAGMTAPHLSEYEKWPGYGPRPSGRRPTPYLLAVLAAVYDCAVTDLIDLTDRECMPAADLLILDKYGLHISRKANGKSWQNQLDALAPDLAFPPMGSSGSMGSGTLSEMISTPRITDMIAEPASRGIAAGLESFASILTGDADCAAASESAPLRDISSLTAEAGHVRRAYQACRYSELAWRLPALIARLDTSCEPLAGDALAKARELSADVYHVAAGFLLKFDVHGLACLAADRSMRAAKASRNPVTIAASARIITHTLMAGGHLPAAVAAATSHAVRLDQAMAPHTADSLSVYGALLLRGSVAAARHGDRAVARDLLGEADETARRLGADIDANLCWTAFGPVNAMLHRVNVAVALGDAGTAIETASNVDLSKITVIERKVTLLLDVSRAFLQWGRHQKAYTALRTAEATAPQEVSSRPSAHRLLLDLRAAAPPSIRRDVDQFATQIGVAS